MATIKRIGLLVATAMTALLVAVMVSGTAHADHDTGWPRLTSSTPAPGDVMARGANVTVEFSESLDPTTLKTPAGYNNVEVHKWNKKKKRWMYVPASVSCDAACDTVTLDPYPGDASRPLVAGKYRARAWRDPVGLKGADGNPLSDFTDIFAGYRWGPLDSANNPSNSPDYIYWTFRVA
ncbi:MAG: Ig-like domain-containing protein [Actinomycetota bacterium]|nr:Ig-like domain-containing protein [Actinomycetota bacterium]